MGEYRPRCDDLADMVWRLRYELRWAVDIIGELDDLTADERARYERANLVLADAKLTLKAYDSLRPASSEPRVQAVR